MDTSQKPPRTLTASSEGEQVRVFNLSESRKKTLSISDIQQPNTSRVKYLPLLPYLHTAHRPIDSVGPAEVD